MARFPTAVSTAYSTNIWATNEQPVDMYKSMIDSYAALAPLTVILTRLSSGSTANDRIDWTEKSTLPTQIRVTAAVSASATTMTVADHYTYLRNHDMLFNPKTFELIKLGNSTAAEDGANSTIQITKGWAGSDDSAIESGQLLELISSAYYEGSEEQYPRQALNTNFYNYTQEIKDSTRHSRRNMNEKSHFGGKGTKREEDNRDMVRNWRIKFEKALFMSYRSKEASAETAFTSQYIYSMGGLIEKLYNGSNYNNFGGPLTETALENWLTSIYEGMPDTNSLLCLCAPKVYQRINQLVKPLIRLSPNSKRYGMNLKQYDGAITMDLVRHPLFVGNMSGWIFLLDLSHVRLIYQKKPVLERDVAMKRYNYVEDQMYALATMMCSVEERHAFADGIT